MTTTLTPPPATSPKPAPAYTRFVSVRANLMPDEVLSKRQTEVVRKQVLCGLVIVAALLAAWFGLSRWQTSSANGDLHSAQRHHVTLLGQQRGFARLVDAQTQTQTIQAELQKLMVGDLSWKDMLSTLRAKAPAGVVLTNVSGSVTTAVAAVTGPSQTQTAITSGAGQLTITGTAHTKSAVAAYSDLLGRTPGLASPLITNITASGPTATFSMSVAITPQALGGRYAVAPQSQTGGH